MMKIFNIFFYTVFIGLMLGVAGLLVGSMLPIPGNIELKIVKSGSMEPTIPTGSLVIVKPMQNYSINDVVTFGADTKTEIPTTHRIIGFESDADGRSVYRTQGDANEDPDANPVGRGEVIGKVVFHLPYIGFVLDFARQPLGFALLIGVPATLVILEEIFTIVKEVKTGMRRRRRKEEGDDDEPQGSDGMRLREVINERTIYLRKRAMDEIFVPMMAETRTWMHERLPRAKDAYASGTIAVGALVGISMLTTGGMQGTIAYFNDMERSIGNFFQAAECDDFILGSCDPVDPPEPTLARMIGPEEEGAVLGVADEEEPVETPEESEVPAEPVTEPENKPVGEPAPEEGSAQMAPIEPPEPPAETPEEEASVEPTPEPEPQAESAAPADVPSAE